MDYILKKMPKSMVEIRITVPRDRIEEFRKKACEEISKEVKVKGFRPGHIPPHVLEEYIDKKSIEAHARELAIRQTYAEVVVKEKVQVIASPEVKIENEEPLTFVATVAILPEVELKDYKSIKVSREESKVTAKDVEQVLEDIKKHTTAYKDVDREARKGDRVEVDFEGFDDHDQPIPNTKSGNHPIVLGDSTMVPGFEDQLIGLKKSEKKEFDIAFPKDYHKKDFQKRKVHFKVEMKRVEEGTAPELDEAFVEKVSGKKGSIDQLKTDIGKDIQAKNEQAAQRKQENEYIEKVLAKAKVEIPKPLIDEEVGYILREMKDDIAGKGLEFDKFLEQNKLSEEDLRKKYYGEAEKRVKIRLVIQHLIGEEGVTVSDGELAEELEKIRSFYPQDQHGKIQAEFDQGQLKNQLRNRLSLRKLFARVLQ